VSCVILAGLSQKDLRYNTRRSIASTLQVDLLGLADCFGLATR